MQGIQREKGSGDVKALCRKSALGRRQTQVWMLHLKGLCFRREAKQCSQIFLEFGMIGGGQVSRYRKEGSPEMLSWESGCKGKFWISLQGVPPAMLTLNENLQVVVALHPFPCPTLTLMTGLQRERTWPLLLTDSGEEEYLYLRKSVIIAQASFPQEPKQVMSLRHLWIPKELGIHGYIVAVQYMLSEWLNARVWNTYPVISKWQPSFS